MKGKLKKTKISLLVILLGTLSINLVLNSSIPSLNIQGTVNSWSWVEYRVLNSNVDMPNIICNSTWGGSGEDLGYSTALDSLGSIYVAGSTNSFGAGGIDAFLVKYDSAGLKQWNITWGGSATDVAFGVKVDSTDNAYIAGYTWSFGAGCQDAFLAKYDSTGTQQWNKTWGGSSNDEGRGLSIDNANNIYIVGYSNSFGAGGQDAFLVKYDNTGAQQWNSTWGTTFTEVGYGIAVDTSNNPHITGYILKSGYLDAFVVKFTSTGIQQWNSTWGGGTYTEVGYGVTVDSENNVYITGYTNFIGAGGDDAFIVKYNNMGVQQWVSTWGGTSGERGYSITNDNANNIYVTGFTSSFGAGSDDAFLVKYTNAGDQLWNITWGGASAEIGHEITLNGLNIVMTGETKSFGVGSTDVFYAKYSLNIPSDPDQNPPKTNSDSTTVDSETTVDGFPLIFLVIPVTLGCLIFWKRKLDKNQIQPFK